MGRDARRSPGRWSKGLHATRSALVVAIGLSVLVTTRHRHVLLQSNGVQPKYETDAIGALQRCPY